MAGKSRHSCHLRHILAVFEGTWQGTQGISSTWQAFDESLMFLFEARRGSRLTQVKTSTKACPHMTGSCICSLAWIMQFKKLLEQKSPNNPVDMHVKTKS